MKTTFINHEQLCEITKRYPTPFHLYDERGIRENARKLKQAFSWNKGFKEYFAVKATPNPYILKILNRITSYNVCYTKLLRIILEIIL